MASERASFEVQVQRDGRWSTETVRDTEEEALASAKRYLGDKRCEGARVIRNWTRHDGRVVETEVFCETRTVSDDGPVRINAIEDAPPRCETPDQYTGLQSRMVMNRLFRAYLDKTFVTPTEVLHNYRELKRLQDKDNLVPSAVDRVAVLQTRDGSQDSRSRGEEIHKNLDRIAVRARKAEALKLPKLNGSFAKVRRQVAELGEGDPDYLALVALSRDLVNLRNWVAKLDRLCRLAEAETDPHALELLDGVIADVLGANVVHEVLGWQPGLGPAIIAMFDLADGCLRTDKSDVGDCAEVLNRLFADRKLPASRTCLLDRAHRQIRSGNPLFKAEPAKERDAFQAVVNRVLTPTGFVEGPETAEALTLRQTRMVVEGGAAGRRAALNATFHAMPDAAYGLMYLCAMAHTAMGKEHAPDIAELLDRVLSTRTIGELCQRGLGIKERLVRATNAHHAVMASPFPQPVRTRVAEHIDALLERHLIDEKIIEKLDHPDSALRDRAVRLVQFCAAGVLPAGKALALARQRIVALLRQPNFDQRFIEGIGDPAKAAKALTDFHHLLVKAGFGG